MTGQVTRREPRGLRNNNPLNIEKSGDKWQGLAPVQSDPRFCTFKAPEWGVRAGVKILRTYQQRYKLFTLRQMIRRYAPSVENNTRGYVQAVARRAKIRPDVAVDLYNRDVVSRLIEAMWYVECGVAGDLEVIGRGLDLLGL